MGVGYGVVSSAVVGHDCSCRERKSILSEEKTAKPVIYRGVFGYGMGWGVNPVFLGKYASASSNRFRPLCLWFLHPLKLLG